MIALRLAVVLLAPLLLAGSCSPSNGGGGSAPPVLRLREPKKNVTLIRMPTTLTVDWRETADTGSLVVTLNDVDVTADFVPGPPEDGRIAASAAAFWDEALLVAGENVLHAEIEHEGSLYGRTRSFTLEGDPFADAVTSTFIDAEGNGGFNASFLPDIVLGPPAGDGLFQGSLDVVSLGFGGEIVVEFVDNVIVDGEGVDFTVFENAFLTFAAGFLTGWPFADAGRVSVSQDGVVWHVFPCALDPGDAPEYVGCAGIYPVLSDGTAATPHPSIPTETPLVDLVGVPALTLPVPAGSGGDSFDLADVGLGWARFVRVESADFADGPIGANNAGFDLDAVAAVHAASATDADGNGVPDAVE